VADEDPDRTAVRGERLGVRGTAGQGVRGTAGQGVRGRVHGFIVPGRVRSGESP
jgi:hypothetical protein